MLVVLHYGEIATKGENREKFERKLIENVAKALKPRKIYRRYGRIVCEVEKEKEEVIRVLELLPGIEYFSFAKRADLSIESIKKEAVELLKEKSFETFKVETKRSNKSFPLTSMEVNKILGEHIVKELAKKVSMKPELKVYVEICEKEAFIYTEKYHGIGGLPVSSSGKVISLLSGGIDSPVAAFLAMKRGCNVVFVHFFNEYIQTDQSKIEKIVKQLTNVQLESKLYLVPLGEMQREIVKNVPAEYRMILYRIAMMKIANKIAEKENAKAIVTGDSIGQVASQTLENLRCIYQASELPVLAPLIGMNKMETVKLAKKIGTYEYSILPYGDCCSFLIAPHPATKAKLEEIKAFEKHIREDFIEESMKKMRVVKFKFES